MENVNGGDGNIVEVVAALIRDKDRFLICQRPANKAQIGRASCRERV